MSMSMSADRLLAAAAALKEVFSCAPDSHEQYLEFELTWEVVDDDAVVPNIKVKRQRL